jgi:hypothetical protein
MIGSSPYGFGNFSVELGSASSARLPTWAGSSRDLL